MIEPINAQLNALRRVSERGARQPITATAESAGDSSLNSEHSEQLVTAIPAARMENQARLAHATARDAMVGSLLDIVA